MDQDGTIVKITGANVFIPGVMRREHVLKNINLTVAAGEHCALHGANGAGKTSLMKLMHGDLWPDTGQIVWRDGDGFSQSRITAREIGAYIGPEIQAGHQLYSSWISVRDFLFSALNMGDGACEESLLGHLERLDAIAWLDKSLPQLSQGQLKCVILLCELLRNPSLLLLDEWDNGLDFAHRQFFLELLAEMSAKTTMIFASHRKSGLPDWIKRDIWLEAGELCPNPDIVVSQAPRHEERRVFEPGERTLMEVKNATVFIDRKEILRNVNWELRAGEHWRIFGANGAGKSVFLRLLHGDETAAAGGMVRVFSRKLNRHVATLAEKRRVVALVSDFSEVMYGYDLSGLELILSGIDSHVGVYRDYAAEEKDYARYLLRLATGNAVLENVSIRRMSTGQLRRLFLARALAGKPEILLLDEPYTGLDARARDSFNGLLENLAAGYGEGIAPQIVLVSHYDEDACGFINREARIEDGRVETVR